MYRRASALVKRSALCGAAVVMVAGGCGDLRFMADTSHDMAVGTRDTRCIAYGDDLGIDRVYSSAPGVVSIIPPPGHCIEIEALSPGEATIVYEAQQGTASLLIRAVVADELAFGIFDHYSGELHEEPTAGSYPVYGSITSGFVWKAGGKLLRGDSGTGFTTTDASVVELRTNHDGQLEGIYLAGPGTAQILWNGIPGPIVNVVE
jgi:hypothetical protein